MREEVEQILSRIKSGNISENEIHIITERIRATIKEDPSKVRSWEHYFVR